MESRKIPSCISPVIISGTLPEVTSKIYPGVQSRNPSRFFFQTIFSRTSHRYFLDFHKKILRTSFKIKKKTFSIFLHNFRNAQFFEWIIGKIADGIERIIRKSIFIGITRVVRAPEEVFNKSLEERLEVFLRDFLKWNSMITKSMVELLEIAEIPKNKS